MARRARLVRQRQIARHAQQRLFLIVERARQKQGFRLLNAEALGKVVQIVIDRQRGRGKDPGAGLLRHHLFEFISNGQRRERQGEVARGTFVPVAIARLVDLFQPLQPPTVERGALESGVQQR